MAASYCLRDLQREIRPKGQLYPRDVIAHRLLGPRTIPTSNVKKDLRMVLRILVTQFWLEMPGTPYVPRRGVLRPEN